MSMMRRQRRSMTALAALLGLALLLSGVAGYALAADTGDKDPDDGLSWWGQLLEKWKAIFSGDAADGDPAAPEGPAVFEYTGEPLPTLSGAAQLKQLLEESGYSASTMNYGRGIMFDDVMIMESAVEESASGAAEAPAAEAPAATMSKNMAPTETALEDSAEYSELNTQVAGVDEADIVRTDGTYIYRVRSYENKIDIVQAWPADAMRHVASLDYSDQEFTPREMYVDGSQLVVVGVAWQRQSVSPSPLKPQAKMMAPEYRGFPSVTASCRVIVYDLGSLPAITTVRTVEIEGDYLSSRKVDRNIYVLTNKYLDYYLLENEDYNPNPRVRDSAAGADWRQLDYGEIYYFPTVVQPNYLVTAAFNLEQPDQPADIQTCLGGGNNIYASRDFLYVALSAHDYKAAATDGARDWWWGGDSDQITHLYRFALGDAAMTYAGEGSVPGHILNQFSMDEHNGYFRIATTRGNIWSDGENTSKNNVYVLNADLEITGAVEDIAPGEKIYSARFMGDRAYMVTFRTVDPLFVLDLADPANPAILGQLKIPGYSDYLHPYDENHIIGFGKNSVTYKENAYYLGMKIALFDVSDPANPIEKCQTSIGDRGTESPLLSNHKALLFSREKDLLAFPVTLMELSPSQRASETAGGFPQYGNFSFQGAYVYNLDPASGFTLEQRITHLSEQDYLKAGDHWYDSRQNVERILYIGDVLYTISDSEIRATDRASRQELGSVKH